ncbi:ureidoglycolate hydrolase [Exophiala aquamarina CBS 119918]|uniref:Ureidoglycolate hydrolase n=1 Tax=Exophiala aquamarina CBS 119918 TaxID=1182545 RepID=A0A072PU59_9EURO|nr:ureidoglycolate hydrolase [Exophiala aquamarina CBS 119918]KEF63386.1 ureidoglycolate hydrolase [Exophiala aquamarina CBS 119918]
MSTSPPSLPKILEHPLLLPLELLTPASFAPFGTAISPAFSSNLNTPPSTIPHPLHAPHQPAARYANQNSALKTSPVSIFENRYPPTPPSEPQMSMFSCFPRNLSGIGIETAGSETQQAGSSPRVRFRVAILERHPHTTQTFSPLGLATGEDNNRAKTFFLVIVAPSLPTTTRNSSSRDLEIKSPPDLTRLRAFIAQGDQAVTYGAGTWHAPMVVLGERRVDFLVTQFVNGIADDDCQEVLLGEGNSVGVPLDGLRLRMGTTTKEESRARAAKL